jgi:hypothetical protein
VNNYEAANQRRFNVTGGRLGLKVVLSDGVFWSRGWDVCPFCGGHVNHEGRELEPFAERRGRRTVIGWRCGALRDYESLQVQAAEPAAVTA